MTTNGAKQTTREVVEHHREVLTEVSRKIHDEPELGFEEHFAASVVADALSGAGMQVETGVFGLPTAVKATTGTGPLRVVVCAEYDALAGMGHACGHNLIAAAAVGAGFALARVADDIGLSVTVLGTPAEEGGGGKILMLERGAFDDAHAAMMVHPWPEDHLGARCLAVDHFEVRYSGREAHASASPERGRNAADALVIAQVAIGLLRQHLRQGDQIHGIVTKGGDAVNVVPKEAVGRFMARATTLDDLEVLRPRVSRCFEAGALATGTELVTSLLAPTYSHMVSDPDLLVAWRENAEQLGRSYRSAGAVLPTISTDMANVSLTVPTIHPLIGIDSAGAVNHQPEFARACLGPSSEKAIVDGAVAMAWTAIDASTLPELREKLLSRVS